MTAEQAKLIADKHKVNPKVGRLAILQIIAEASLNGEYSTNIKIDPNHPIFDLLPDLGYKVRKNKKSVKVSWK